MYGDTMVTQRIKYRRSMGRWKISPIRNLMLVGLLLLSAAASLCAGDFNNSGAMNNTGKIRVKNGVSGLPDSLGGVFEYFGGTQTVQAITYDSLSLTGDSIKTAATTGTLAIFNNVSVASAVTLSIPNGQFMRLDQNSGRLTENGIVHGKVTNAVNFIKSADSSDFGGIGLSIRFSGTTPPGTTQILRYSGLAPAGAPNALTRYYTVRRPILQAGQAPFSLIIIRPMMSHQDITPIHWNCGARSIMALCGGGSIRQGPPINCRNREIIWQVFGQLPIRCICSAEKIMKAIPIQCPP